MNVRTKIALLYPLALLCMQVGHAQQVKSREQLEKERKRLETEVQMTHKLIGQTKQHQKRSLTELQLLQRQIALNEKLVRNIKQDVEVLGGEIAELNGIINAMTGDVRSLQKNYSHVAYVTYKHSDNVSVLMWLLSAESFSQAYNRLMYFREFGRFRKNQILLIRRTQGYLAQRKAEVGHKRSEKKELEADREAVGERLGKSKTEKNIVFRVLRSQEQNYNKQLAAYRNELLAVNSEIDRMIKAEIARTRTNAGKQKKSEHDADVSLAGQFEKNRGKLPWPIPAHRAVVTSRFGRQEDASGGVVQNDGIFLSTEKGVPVRSVFNGRVTQVKSNKVIGTVVIVQHGNYRSVYVGFKEVFVKQGDEVTTMQQLGTVAADGRAGASELHFLLFNDRTPLDPMQWIASKED